MSYWCVILLYFFPESPSFPPLATAAWSTVCPSASESIKLLQRHGQQNPVVLYVRSVSFSKLNALNHYFHNTLLVTSSSNQGRVRVKDCSSQPPPPILCLLVLMMAAGHADCWHYSALHSRNHLFFSTVCGDPLHTSIRVYTQIYQV